MTINRRGFIQGAGTLFGSTCFSGCFNPFEITGPCDGSDNAYSVAILGDTHYDAEPESVYHSHYDESNRWAKVQHEEFRRNGEMWRERCPQLLAASAELARKSATRFVLQLGDIIQGDCDDVPTHKKMLDDCIKLLRAPYPRCYPFLTVIGNHDFRGKGARQAYMDFAEAFMSDEITKLTGTMEPVSVKYPAFSFSTEGDLWVFCDFETKNLQPVIDCIESDAKARHVFLVTHGPFTTPDADRSFRWRLGGRKECVALRSKLYELLSRRHAIVLSGHTHTTAYYRHENEFGGFCEFTSNSVWAKPELATAQPICSSAGEYGAVNLAKFNGEKLEDFKSELEFFRSGLKEYFYNNGAGHYRLDVSKDAVKMSFYPGDSKSPARTFSLA